MSDVILLLFLSLIFFLIRLRDASAGTKGNNQATAKNKISEREQGFSTLVALVLRDRQKKTGARVLQCVGHLPLAACDDKDRMDSRRRCPLGESRDSDRENRAVAHWAAILIWAQRVRACLEQPNSAQFTWTYVRLTSPASRESMGHPSRCGPVPTWW